MYKFLKSIFQCLHLLSVSIFNTFDKFFQLFFFKHRFISFQNRCLNFLFIIFHILPQYISDRFFVIFPVIFNQTNQKCPATTTGIQIFIIFVWPNFVNNKFDNVFRREKCAVQFSVSDRNY